MYGYRPWRPRPEEDANRQTASLAAFVVILLLLASGLFLVHTLRAKAKLEDCLMSGRHDCDSLVSSAR